MIHFYTIAINVILCFPFILAVYVVYKGIRGVLNGEIKSGKGGHQTLSKDSTPIQFWLEIAGYFLFAAVLVLMGLSFFGHAPRWFEQFIRSSRHR